MPDRSAARLPRGHRWVSHIRDPSNIAHLTDGRLYGATACGQRTSPAWRTGDPQGQRCRTCAGHARWCDAQEIEWTNGRTIEALGGQVKIDFVLGALTVEQTRRLAELLQAVVASGDSV